MVADFLSIKQINKKSNFLKYGRNVVEIFTNTNGEEPKKS